MKNYLLLPLAIAFTVMVTGCASRERERFSTYEVSSADSNSVVTETRQEYRNPKNRVVNRQIIREKIKCVGRNGNTISATTAEECIKKKGKIVDETYVEEQRLRR